MDTRTLQWLQYRATMRAGRYPEGHPRREIYEAIADMIREDLSIPLPTVEPWAKGLNLAPSAEVLAMVQKGT